MSAPANGKLMGAKLIEQLANPASIAIVGASSDLTSTSGRPLAHLLNYGYPGRIVPSTRSSQVPSTWLWCCWRPPSLPAP